MKFKLNDEEQIVYNSLKGDRFDNPNEAIRLSVLIVNLFERLTWKDINNCFAMKKSTKDQNVKIIGDFLSDIHFSDEDRALEYAEEINGA